MEQNSINQKTALKESSGKRKCWRSIVILKVVVAMVLGVAIMGGCGPAPESYRRGEGFEFGFRRYNQGGPLMIAIRSENTYFDIGDVTFEIHFGWNERYRGSDLFDVNVGGDSRFENIGVVKQALL